MLQEHARRQRTPSQTPSVPRVSPALTLAHAPHPPPPPAARPRAYLAQRMHGVENSFCENTCDGQVVFPACFPGPLLLLEALASAATGLASDEHDSLSSLSASPLERDDSSFLSHILASNLVTLAWSRPAYLAQRRRLLHRLRLCAREMRGISRREPIRARVAQAQANSPLIRSPIVVDGARARLTGPAEALERHRPQRASSTLRSALRAMMSMMWFLGPLSRPHTRHQRARTPWTSATFPARPPRSARHHDHRGPRHGLLESR